MDQEHENNHEPIDNRTGNDKDNKHREAKLDLEELKHVLAEIRAEETKEQPKKIRKVDMTSPAEEAPKPEESKPEAPKPEAPKPEASKPEAPKPEAPKPEAPKPEAPKPEATESAAEAEREQEQREQLLEQQAKRRHPEQPPATVHLDASANAGGKKSSASGAKNEKKPAGTHTTSGKKKNSKAATHRRAVRRIRIGGLIAALLIVVVVVVAAIRGISGVRDNNSTAAGSAGSGTQQTQQTQVQDDTPASQQESEQYKKIKDDTTLPAYALEYPGMYSDAVSEANKESDSKVCYLTFDDGPSSTNTANVLDVLKENNVNATFFVVTSEIDGNEDTIKRMVEEGNTLCIHCNEHEYSNLYASVDSYLKDFATAYDKIYELTGYRVQGFRFPGGSNNSVMKRHGTYDAIVTEMTRRGFEYYDWNAYDHDAENGNYSVDEMVNYAVSEVTESSRKDVILLMHDTYGKEKTVEALPSIIAKLKAQNIQLLPITNTTRPVHFEVNDTTPPDLPQADTNESSSDASNDSKSSTDSQT